ncbi:D-alanyl-D-alanine carboxypeptidase family protein [Paenibacillus sediminis]|uniref:serine-type D-Ala-D-Ala carboxypeptidase n=1 Tax=Paenibacillus sediminis TaxID=664909 RepID=A0ABS4H7S8_9BACL|nr:D-alanyl-D-alanine carboxypeptidase family protein [Paenibacillus sediminis]MBP1938580.1 D-alanyl-D-alanine carboxypeptidase (penicillin-binding protein 5/6) [Paenibacillus sediminis]
MKDKQLHRNKKEWVKKSVASALLLNMLCSSVAPVMAYAESGQTTATVSTNAASQSAMKVPSVDSIGLNVSSAVLLDAATGQVLLSKNSDVPLPPASMTKMMTEYIVAEQVKQGKLSWDTMVTTSENASLQTGSKVFLAEGDQHTVKDLYIAMAVGSANDATVALAEYVAGSEQQFVKMMNETAQRMGMKTAYFINATGLSRADMPEKYRPNTDRETVMSAMDAAILAKYIVNDHPDFNQFTTIQSYKFRPRDKAPIVNLDWMLEANKSIPNFKAYAYEGLDGLKTGHTEQAGYCFTGTAVRNGMRLISVVMGTDSEAHRFTETRKVLDYGFNNFEEKQIIAPKSTVKGVEKVAIKKGKETKVPVVTDQAVSFVVPKGTNPTNVTFTTKIDDNVVAPIKAGTKVGTITYTYKVDGTNQTEQRTVNLVAAQDVDKASGFRLFFRSIKNFFVDLFDGVKNLF